MSDLKPAMDNLMRECVEILMRYPCRVSIETRNYLEDQARREEERELPDFSHAEFARQVVDSDLVPAVTELMSLFKMGKHCSHEALLHGCAMLERALLKKWTDG